MCTVPQDYRLVKRAYGPHNGRSTETLATHIAESIQLRLDAGDTWHLMDYGLDRDLPLRELVWAALRALLA